MAKAKVMTAREAAQRMRLRLDSTYALIWAGKLPAQKRDGRWLIRAAAVDARLKGRKDNGR